MSWWIPVRNPGRLMDAARSEAVPAGPFVAGVLSTLRSPGVQNDRSTRRVDKARGTTHRITDRIRTRRIHHSLERDREAGRWMRFAYPPCGRWVYGRSYGSTSSG